MQMQLFRNKMSSVLRLSGRVELDSYPYLKRSLNSSESESLEKLIVDLEHVDTISSSCIGALMSLQKELKQRNQELVLVNPSPACMRVFELLRLTEYFEMFATEEAALSN